MKNIVKYYFEKLKNINLKLKLYNKSYKIT